jgi:hypothetical protein
MIEDELYFLLYLPKSARHAAELDKINGTNVWKEASGKELLQIDE